MYEAFALIAIFIDLVVGMVIGLGCLSLVVYLVVKKSPYPVWVVFNTTIGCYILYRAYAAWMRIIEF